MKKFSCKNICVLLFVSISISSFENLDAFNENDMIVGTMGFVAGLAAVGTGYVLKNKWDQQSIRTEQISFLNLFSPYKYGEKKIGLDDFVVSDSFSSEINSILNYLFTEDCEKYGSDFIRTLLVTGQHGCGKTLLAKLISSSERLNCVYISPNNFLKNYVDCKRFFGSSYFMEIFNQVMNLSKEKPVVIFFDDIDLILKGMSVLHFPGTTEFFDEFNQCLNMLSNNDRIIFMATANDVETLNQYCQGIEFKKNIEIDLPTKEMRDEIFKLNLRRFLSPDDDQLLNEISKDLSSITYKFSGYDIKKLVESGFLHSVSIDGAEKLTKEGIQKAFYNYACGLGKNYNPTKEELTKVAYHEAGHALVSYLLDVPVYSVTILPRAEFLGVTHLPIINEHYGSSKSRIEKDIMIYQGSFIAEKLIFGETADGVSCDLGRATYLANKMVKEVGMGEGELSGVAYSADFSDLTKQKFEQEVFKILNRLLKNTEKLLLENRSLLDKLANALLEKETLYEEEILEILGS